MKTAKKIIAILAIIATVISCFAVTASAITTNDILNRLSNLDKYGYEYYHSTDGNRLGNLKPGSYFQDGECWQYVLGMAKYVMNKSVNIPSTACYFSGDTRDYFRVGGSALTNCSYNQIVELFKKSQPGDIVGLKNSRTHQTYGHIIFIGNNTGSKLTVYQAYSGQARKQTVDLTVNGLKSLGSFGYGGNANFNSSSYGVCLFRHKDFIGSHTHTKGKFVYNWAAHPHYSCYECGVCGEIWADKTSAKYSGSCSTCNGGTPVWNANNLTAPDSIKRGSCFGLKGTITCNIKMTNITAGIYTDINGNNAKQKVSVNPNSTSYNLNGKVNDSLIFNYLPKGTYYYRVTSTAAGKTNLIINRKFTIVSSLTLSGITKPTSINQGKCFGLKGTITNLRNITNVTAGIYTDASGKNAKQKVSVNPNAKSYNLNGKVNNSLIFNDLPKGTYYYRVTVKDAYGTEVPINQKFTVK